MARYHVNPKTGRPNLCSAKTPDKCLYYNSETNTEAPHFATKTEARAHVEKTMAEVYGGGAGVSLSKSGAKKFDSSGAKKEKPVIDGVGKEVPLGESKWVAKSPGEKHTLQDGSVQIVNKRADWPSLYAHNAFITYNDKIYVHPQGKLIAADYYTGEVRVYKNGKKSSSSATLEKLKKGYGGWKLAKKEFSYPMGNRDYNMLFPQKCIDGSGVLSARETANLDVGYPANSNLDASKASELNMNDTPDNSFSYYDGDPILPISERGNPHKDLANGKDGVGLKFWNYTSYTKNPEGSKEVGNFEVWSDGAGHYKAITTGGKMRALGSVASFKHDQIGSRMGNKWTLVGGFNAEEGGAAIGEIPNQKMPIYTYK